MALFLFQRNSKRAQAVADEPLTKAAAAVETPPPSVVPPVAAPPKSTVPAAVPTPTVTPAAPASPSAADVTSAAPKPAAPAPNTQPAPIPEDRVLYRALMESLYDGILVVNTSGHVVDANSRAYRLLGYEAGHLWYVPLQTLVPSMSAEVIAKVRQHTAEDRFTVLSAPCQRQDGTTFPAELAIRSTRLINAQDLVFCFRDIERQRKARERHTSEIQAARGSAAGMLVCDAGGAIRYANPAFAQLCGLDGEAMAVGRLVHEFLPPPEGGSDLLAFAAENGACTAERIARDASGNEFPAIVNVSLQNGGAPELNQYVVTLVGTAGLRTAAVRLRAAPADGTPPMPLQ